MKKTIPEHSKQHITAGPYAPVIEVEFDKLVVISGQAALDGEGCVQGDTFSEQTEYALRNCLTQLGYAGCTMSNVFKVNVFLTNPGMWSEFNQIYEQFIADPRPVRTAVQAGLLPGLLVEIEMWAAK